MIQYRLTDGSIRYVSPENEDALLNTFPGATKVEDEPIVDESKDTVVKDIDISPAGLFFNVLQETRPAVGKPLAALANFGKNIFDIGDMIGDFGEAMVEITAESGYTPGSGIAPYVGKRIAARRAGISLEEYDETNPYNIIELKSLSNALDKARVKYIDKETGQEEDFLSLFEKGKYNKAAESFMYEVAGAAPSLIVSMIPGGYAMLGGGAFAEKLNKDLFERPDQTAEKILANAIVYGGSDAIGEYFGGRFLRKLSNVGRTKKGFDLEGMKNVMVGGIGNLIKTAFKGGSFEAMQEAITSVIQSKSDEIIYGDDVSNAQHFRQALHAGIIGFALGGTSGSVSTQINRANKTKLYEYLAQKSYKKDQTELSKLLEIAEQDLKNAPKDKKEKFQKIIDQIKNKKQKLQDQLYDRFEIMQKENPQELELMLEKIQEQHDALDIINGGRKYSNEAKEQAKKDFKEAADIIGDIFAITDINYDPEVELELSKYIRAAEEIDEANKSLWFKSKDLKYDFIKTQEQYENTKKEYKEKGIEIDSQADGFFTVTQDGQKRIFINQNIAASANATNVIGHELLHYALSNRFANDPKYLRDSVIAFNQYLDEVNPYIKKTIEKKLSNPKLGYAKLDENGKVQRDADGLIIMKNDSWIEEYFTMFSDLIKDEKIDVVEDASMGIKNTFRTTIRGLGLGFNNIDFKNGQEVFNFLIDYNKNLGRKGLLGAITQRQAIKQAAGKKVKEVKPTIKKSRSQLIDTINDLQQGATTKADFQKPSIFNKVFEAVQSGGAINNYIRSLQMSPEKTQETIDAVTDRLIKVLVNL
jgi:hypothetical protein